MLENLGKDLDIVAGIYPSTRWKRRCQILPLTEIPLCCAVSRQNPLSSRKKLRLPDLYGENLLMVERGDTIGTWAELHPSLVAIPCEWDYTVPYGIVYAENPSALVLEFIGIMKKFSKIG